MSKRSDLVDALSTKLGSTKKDADGILMDVIDVLKARIAADGEAVLPGFGRLRQVQLAERAGRNPKTGEAIVIAAKTVVKFKQF